MKKKRMWNVVWDGVGYVAAWVVVIVPVCALIMAITAVWATLGVLVIVCYACYLIAREA